MQPRNVHDLTFREIMQQPKFVKHFLKVYLPDVFQDRVDWDSFNVVRVNSSSITQVLDQSISEEKTPEEILREYIADVVYLFKYRDLKSEGYQTALAMVHCEHMSTPQEMAERFFVYVANEMAEYRRHHPKGLLPVIIPILYYHGKGRYPYSLDIFEKFADKELAKQFLLSPQLKDLSQMSEQEIVAHDLISPIELAFKQVFGRRSEESLQYLFEVAKIQSGKYNDAGYFEFLSSVLRYSIRLWNKEKPNEFYKQIIQNFPAEGESLVQTIQQKLEQEFINTRGQDFEQKGKQEGKQEIAFNLFQHGADLDFVAKVSELPISTLKELQQRIKKESH